MRVIAGTAGGRRLVTPKGRTTRPTADRVREAVFSSLQPVLSGARVLDLFAGSGALAIEALSRGAATATLVEFARPAVTAIRTNIETAGMAGRATVVAAALPGALARCDGPFDLLLVDPPYDLDREVLGVVLDRAVALLSVGAEVRLERATRAGDPPWPEGLMPGRVRHYGDTSIHEAVGRETTPP